MSENDIPVAPESSDAESVTPPAQDEIKNLKMEFSRKMDNTNAQLQALLNEMKSSKPAQSEAKPVSVYDNEQEFRRQIKEEAKAEIRSELATKESHNSKYQATINSIVQEYPEVSNTSSELMVRAQEIFASLGDDEKSSPIAMKAAVTSAAAELGIRPKSKRSTSSNDNFSLGSGSTPKSTKKSEIDPRTEAFAKMVGLDLSKPEVRERLKGKR